MYDPRIILLAKIITPVSFLCTLFLMPTMYYAYQRDINKGIHIDLMYIILPEMLCLFWLVFTWWYMTRKWGWFKK